jgi:hypothetical protein
LLDSFWFLQAQPSSDLHAGWGMKMPLARRVRGFGEYPLDYIGGYIQSASFSKD